MGFEDFLNLLNQVHPELSRGMMLLITIGIIVVVYKGLSWYSKRFELNPHLQNVIQLLLRIVLILIGTIVVFDLFELPTDWIVGGSALVGAAIGFGSSHTINNIIAGFYVIISRPFMVKDYVVIGDLEGQVEEISLNYTKLYTPSFNLLEVPNMRVMNSQVMNCTHEGFIKYTFSLGFPHTVVNEEIETQCIEPAIDAFHEKHRAQQLRRPEYYFERSTHVARSYKIRIFIPKGEAKTLYTLQPELSNMIMKRWDLVRHSGTS